jgi:hypothetical protein
MLMLSMYSGEAEKTIADKQFLPGPSAVQTDCSAVCCCKQAAELIANKYLYLCSASPPYKTVAIFKSTRYHKLSCFPLKCFTEVFLKSFLCGRLRSNFAMMWQTEFAFSPAEIAQSKWTLWFCFSTPPTHSFVIIIILGNYFQSAVFAPSWWTRGGSFL